MKIYENGKTREMTVEEINSMQSFFKEQRQVFEPLTFEKKIELILNAIPEEPMPITEPKLGYKWKPTYTPSSGFAWELVEDPNTLGTLKNPWYWIAEMAVETGHHYTTNGTDIYVALQDGIPDAWANEEWFYKV